MSYEANLKKVGNKKSQQVKKLILEALDILNSVNVPLGDLTPRRLEKMAMAFMAVADVNTTNSWSKCKSINNEYHLRTREVISYINQNFEEKISSGSYDDIRRKDLIRPVSMKLVIKAANNPDADTNDGTRGYSIEPGFAQLIKTYKTSDWKKALDNFEIDEEFIKAFKGERKIAKLPVTLLDGEKIELDSGPHNQIQKSVIEEFLPRFGYDAQVLYVGDTSNKLIRKYNDKMKELGLDIEDRGMLPDIVAFSNEKKWLYLIEAVHSSNPFNPERCIELKRTVLKDCPFDVVFVTAFLSKKDFSKWLPQIAWETEVWLVDNPDHMIHFNGDKFIGPHTDSPYIG